MSKKGSFDSFEIHGVYTLVAWLLIGLWLLGLFLHTTIGEWRQYMPAESDSMLAMIRYFSVGIFLGADHPFHRRRAEKHNLFHTDNKH
jgi:thiosulfate reductase cytochrome b subunit